MINGYTALSQNFLKFAIGDRLANIEENRVQNDTFRKMNALEFYHHPHLPHSIMRTEAKITQQK